MTVLAVLIALLGELLLSVSLFDQLDLAKDFIVSFSAHLARGVEGISPVLHGVDERANFAPPLTLVERDFLFWGDLFWLLGKLFWKFFWELLFLPPSVAVSALIIVKGIVHLESAMATTPNSPR